MRRIKRPRIGEYVLATRWHDKDPNDPWYVGFVESVIETANGFRYMLHGSRRKWRHVFRISREEGEEWLRLYGEAQPNTTCNRMGEILEEEDYGYYHRNP